MRRGIVLALLALGALALVLYPSLWRALGRLSRTFLLAATGAMLAAAAWRLLGGGPLPPLTLAETVAASAGIALLAISFALVLFDQLRRR